MISLLIKYILDTLKPYADLWGAVATLISSAVAAGIAIYFGYFHTKRLEPKLKLCFLENPDTPFLKEIGFEPQTINFQGQPLQVAIPAVNARLKIFNAGKSTAKNVQARIEKIELYHANNSIETLYYHPTTVKWSGEPDWKPVDIVSQSYFFLDLFYSKNEEREAVKEYNAFRYQNEVEREDWDFLVDRLTLWEGKYWNVWVKSPLKRGLSEKLTHQGKFILFFVVNSENSKAIRFKAVIEWDFDNWNQPKIRICQNGNYIIHDCV